MHDIAYEVAILYHRFAIYYLTVERYGALFYCVLLRIEAQCQRRDSKEAVGKTNVVSC